MQTYIDQLQALFQDLNWQSYYVIAAILATALLLIMVVRRRQKKSTTSESGALFAPKTGFAGSLKSLLVGNDKRLEDLVPDLEEILLTADVGVTATESLINKVLEKKKIDSQKSAYDFLKAEIENKLTAEQDFKVDRQKKPYVIYLVGVNGVGKTTTIGKLASQFKREGLKVMLVAADTFRAAAVDQLRVWSERNQVAFMGGDAQADPSSVIVDGLRSAQAKDIDVVLVDTAGRLQTKTNLMQELQKMVRMSDKVLNRAPDEVFLVVDAITGQNGFSQAQIFLEATPLSGVILTKYDATSKGGIIISIVEQTGLPIRYVGLGEGIEDLKPFDAKEFVERIFG